MDKLKLNVKTAAESTIGRRRGTRKDQWVSNETWELIDSRKNMKALRDQAKTTKIISSLEKITIR